MVSKLIFLLSLSFSLSLNDGEVVFHGCSLRPMAVLVSISTNLIFQELAVAVPSLSDTTFDHTDSWIRSCGASCSVPQHLLLESFSWIRPLLFSTNDMKMDFNRDSCPQGEQFVRSTMHRLYKKHSSVAPALLRLLFHDCLIQAGCPSLLTGRRASFVSFPEVASYEVPSPHDDLSKTLTSFASRGFDERETVSLLGAHKIGRIHCQFYPYRLYNFQGTGLPDPSLEAGYLNLMRSRCNNSKSHSEEPGMNMGYEGKTGPEFGTHYYKTLMQGKGILHVDQQLMSGEGTASWVEAYASERSLFRRGFAQVMMIDEAFKPSRPDKIAGPNQAQLL